jgi:hypothetical protein
MLSIRPYKHDDYFSVISLYKQSELYGGQFDENRDSQEKLAHRIAGDPESILFVNQKIKLLEQFH